MEDKRNNNRKPTRKDYDGVIYEPSREMKDRMGYSGPPVPADRQRNQASRPRSTRPGQPTRRRKKPPKSQFAIFYIATLFTGVVVCIVIFAVVFNSISGTKVKTPVAITPSPGPTDVAIKELNELTGVIQRISESSQSLQVLNIETGKSYNLEATGTSQLNNKYGQAIVFGELSIGNIVEVSFDVKSSTLNHLTVSPQAWDMKLVKDIRVDTVEKSMVIGNDTYQYDSNIIVSYNGSPYELRNITPIDVLSVTGYKDMIWYIELNKSHGLLSFINADKIIDGIVEIDTTVHMPLEDTEPMTILEGSHRIVVKGSNIEPYTKEVLVKQGDTTEIDLDEVQIMSGMLTLRVNEQDYALFIDEEEMPVSEPSVLTYGEHKVRVEKEDFEFWEEIIVISEPVKEVNVELTRIIKMAKIKVITYPEGASVYIDNGIVGESPVDKMVEYGDHTIIVRKDGFTDITLHPSITLSEHIFEVILTQKSDTLPAPDYPATMPDQTPLPTINWE